MSPAANRQATRSDHSTLRHTSHQPAAPQTAAVAEADPLLRPDHPRLRRWLYESGLVKRLRRLSRAEPVTLPNDSSRLCRRVTQVRPSAADMTTNGLSAKSRLDVLSDGVVRR
jgi:hypothetical protein